jgi:hypothetical protein
LHGKIAQESPHLFDADRVPEPMKPKVTTIPVRVSLLGARAIMLQANAGTNFLNQQTRWQVVTSCAAFALPSYPVYLVDTTENCLLFVEIIRMPSGIYSV